MARWDDGYVTDVVYTQNFYRETTPSWLATAALLLGHRPPDLAKPYRYADLGCGHGMTALTVAATSPQAEVWAFDFNPAHIEFGRLMAAKAGLTNIHFQEASFVEIAAMPANALPQFDIIVSHGVLSWISEANGQRLIDIIGQRLQPGGLAYLGYNVGTGWSGMVPLRALMRMLMQANHQRSDLAVPSLWAYIDRLKEANAGFFTAHPSMEARLATLRAQDARYVAHELLNQDWRPIMSADVAAAMADVKCSFIGSATLTENIDAVSVPAAMIPMLAEAPTQALRETLRDFGTAQGFRRDIFRRGAPALAMAEHHALLENLELSFTGQTAPGDVTFTTPLGSMTGNADAYRPLLNLLEAGGFTIRQARTVTPFNDRPVVELLQAAALLMSGGFAHPVLPGGNTMAARQSTAALNLAVAEANIDGADIPRLTVPAWGSTLNADITQTMVVGSLLAGEKAELRPLAAALESQLRRGNRTLQRDGQPVTDAGQARDLIAAIVRQVLDTRTPMYRRLGILGE